MTFQDQAVLTQLIFFVFCAGIFTGAICTGILNSLKAIFFTHVECPKRIKSQQGYLYRYRGLYITRESRDIQVQHVREKILNEYRTNPILRRQRNHTLFWAFVLFALTLFLFFYVDPFTSLHLK